MSLASTTMIVFLIMNSIGHIPAFVGVLEPYSPAKRMKIILREALFAAIILLVFYVLGRKILHLLQINISVVQMAGGLILFLKSIKMIFPRIHSGNEAGSYDSVPFIVPIATPLFVGSSVLALVLVYSGLSTTFFDGHLLALLLALASSTVILMSSFVLKGWLGTRGLNACERLMGLLLLLLAIEMILTALHAFIDTMPIV